MHFSMTRNTDTSPTSTVVYTMPVFETRSIRVELFPPEGFKDSNTMIHAMELVLLVPETIRWATDALWLDLEAEHQGTLPAPMH